MRHFLKETDFSYDEAKAIFARAAEYKARRMERHLQPLKHQTWGMIFYKKSTRTRVSFDVGLQELGAGVIINTVSDSQISRGESISDTAQVLSRYLHGLIIRCYEHETLEEFAKHGSVPVVNALSDLLHPCQIYTDAFTLAERWAQPGEDLLDSLKGRKLVFYGDTACNMANSWLLGGAMFGMNIVLSGPEGFEPTDEAKQLMQSEGFGGNITFTTDAKDAAKDADVLYTDVWVSMGKEDEEAARIKEMNPYQVTTELLSLAKPDAYFMHCLPAHPGMEVAQDVLDSPQSIIFDQAENRLHMQKAILDALVTG